MKTEITQSVNRINFLRSYEIVKVFEAIPFYGTLLGLHRDGDIIPGDDDVDYIAPIAVREQLESAMIFASYELSISELTFSQFKKIIEGEEVLVDIYYYTLSGDGQYLIEAWNFNATPNDARTHYHIPQTLIFPLKEIEINSGATVRVPNDLDGICEFMFGLKWMIPYSKNNSDYVYLINDNKPLISYRGDILYQMKIEHNKMKRLIRKTHRNPLKRIKCLFFGLKYE